MYTFFSILSKLEFVLLILVKIPNVKFNENLASKIHVVPDRQIDGLADMSKLIIVSLGLATASTLKSGDQRKHDEACKTLYQKTAKKLYNYCC